MRLKVSDVISMAKRFLQTEAGYLAVSIASVEADEQNARWTVIAEFGILLPERKQLIIDDRDGNVLVYREIRRST